METAQKTPEERGAEWLKSGKTGVSSKTIYNFFISGPPNDPGYPSDSADFGRCAGLLEAVPEWEKRLPELKAIGGMEGEAWAALAEMWPTLNALFYAEELDDLNKKIKEIIEPIEQKSGRVVRLSANSKMVLPRSTVEAAALANYLAITRNAGIPDELAHETYKANKSSSDALAALQIKNTIEAGEAMKKAVAGMGHNSGDEPDETSDIGGVSGKRLRSYLDRIERLEEEKAGIGQDIKDIYAEAKGVGFDAKILRKLYGLRKMNTDKRREEEELLDLYKAAVGMD